MLRKTLYFDTMRFVLGCKRLITNYLFISVMGFSNWGVYYH